MAREEVEVALNIELETKKLSQRMSVFDREIKKASKDVLLLSAVGKSMGKSYVAEMRKSQVAINKFQDLVIKSQDQILKSRRALSSATTEVEKKEIQERIKMYEKEKMKALAASRGVMKDRTKNLSKKVGDTSMGGLASSMEKNWPKFMQKAMRKVEFSAFTKNLAGEAKDALEEGFSSFKGKDLAGMIKGGGKLGSQILKSIGGYGGAALTKGGAKLHAKGTEMGGAGGAALKAMGGMMGKMGPLIGTLAKLGPILSTSAAIFAGIVKILIDAEAAAKDMNREILGAGSNMEILYKNGGNAAKAFTQLDSLLDDIRESATDTNLLKFGIKKEDVLGVVKGYEQMGVTIDGLKVSMDAAADSATVAGSQIQDFNDLAIMAFGYARGMGVALSEITDLQGEMFTEMGASLSGINLEFARMTKDAVESGIATNKFFSIIRGVSSDLSLYTTRLGQASSMLKLLGKAMNPREAAKFMQTAVQGLKQMGEEDRIRLTLLAGEGKMRDIIGKDLNRKTRFLYSDMAKASGETVEEVQKKVEAGGKDLADLLNKTGSQKGAFKSALSEIAMDKNAMNKGGLVGTSEAAANLSAAGAMAATKAALQRFGGGGKLRDMTGLNAMASRKAAGVSLDQFRSMAKMEEAVDQQREEMVGALKNPTPSKEQADMVARLKDLGITSEEQIKAADDADIIAAMEKSDQDNLVAATEQKDWTQQTAKATVSVADKLDSIIDCLFENIYDALKDIIGGINEAVDYIADWLGKDRKKDPVKEAKSTLRAAAEGPNAKATGELRKALNKSPEEFMKKAQGMLDAALEGKKKEEVELYAKEFAKLDNKDYDKLTPDEKKAYQDKAIESGSVGQGSGAESMAGAAEIKKLLAIKATDKSIDDKTEFNGNITSKGDMITGQLAEMLTEEQYGQFTAMGGMNGETSFSDNMKMMQMVGLSPEQQKMMAQVLLGSMDPDKIAQYAASSDLYAGGKTGATPAAKGIMTDDQFDAKMSGQQEAANKSSDPGTPTTATGSVSPGPQAETAPSQPNAAQAVTVSAPATKGDVAVMDSIEDAGIDTVQSLKDLWNLMANKGIKLNKSWLNNDYKEVLEKGALDAIRKGLFEYAIYSAEDPQKVIDQMKKSGFEEVAGMAEKYETETLKANATGGIVTGVSDGVATLKRLPAGEGLASIGPGERILPAGVGGSGGIYQINVNGIGGNDLARYIEVKVAEGVYEYKRRQKYS